MSKAIEIQVERIQELEHELMTAVYELESTIGELGAAYYAIAGHDFAVDGLKRLKKKAVDDVHAGHYYLAAFFGIEEEGDDAYVEVPLSAPYLGIQESIIRLSKEDAERLMGALQNTQPPSLSLRNLMKDD